jgi:hypothetical protein
MEKVVRIIFPSGSIAEAQEWELKIIAVQEWLTEQDMLITSHLDHDLTVDDLPDETQVRNLFPNVFLTKEILYRNNSFFVVHFFQLTQKQTLQ